MTKFAGGILGGLMAAFVLANSALASTYQATVLADNPVGYWRLNEAPNATTATNLGSAGASLDGTYYAGGKIAGTSLIPSDPSSTSADFSGSVAITGTGLQTAGPSSSNVFANDWSIEGWFSRDQTAQWGGIFSSVVAGSYGAPLMDFIDNTDSFGINGAGLTPNNVSVALGGNHFNDTLYAVVTKTGPNGAGLANIDVWLNLNGTWLHSNGTNTGWALATTSDGFGIGRHYDGGLYFDGQISDVAIYNTALSQSQIEAHYAAAVPEPAALVLFGLGAIGVLAVARHRRKA